MSNDSDMNLLLTQQELILSQQRTITQQNDKMLEYLDAIYQGLISLGDEETQEAAPPPPSASDPASLADLLKSLVGEEKPKDPTRPGFGYDTLLERQKREAENDGD